MQRRELLRHFPDKLATTQWMVRRWARQDDKLVRFLPSIRISMDLLDIYGACRGINLDITRLGAPQPGSMNRTPVVRARSSSSQPVAVGSAAGRPR